MSEKKLSEMSDEELLAYYDDMSKLAADYDVTQHNQKITINSL